MPASCLFRGQQLLNKPITARDTGAILGYVHDIVFDQDQNQVLAFLVDPRWRIEARMLPWSGIRLVTTEGIQAHNAAMLTEGVNLLAVRRVFERENIRRGTRLILRDGRSLGLMQDIYFDGHGVMEGYATVTTAAGPGRTEQFVPAPRSVRVMEKRAILPHDHARLMEENPAARRRLANSLRLLAQDLWRNYAWQAADLANEQAREAAVEGLVDRLAENALHLVEGCRVQHTVLAADGRIAAIAGQIVTARGIERARSCDRAREVLVAAGVDPLGALRDAIDGDGALA